LEKIQKKQLTLGATLEELNRRNAETLRKRIIFFILAEKSLRLCGEKILFG
jgi:hypothetical protein